MCSPSIDCERRGSIPQVCDTMTAMEAELVSVDAPDTVRLVAFHEAGHAVAGWLCGQRVTQLEIYGDDEHAGSCHLQRFPPPGDRGGRVDRAAVRDRILCLACGLLAEARAVGRNDWDELSPELDEAVRLAIGLTGDCEAALRLLEATRERAQALLDRHWEAVRLLADELLSRGRLGQRELELLLKARVPAPEPAPL